MTSSNPKQSCRLQHLLWAQEGREFCPELGSRGRENQIRALEDKNNLTREHVENEQKAGPRGPGTHAYTAQWEAVMPGTVRGRKVKPSLLEHLV